MRKCIEQAHFLVLRKSRGIPNGIFLTLSGERREQTCFANVLDCGSPISLFYYNSLPLSSVRRMKYRLSYKVKNPQPQLRYKESRNKHIFTTTFSNCQGSPISVGPWKGQQCSEVKQHGKGRDVTGCVLCRARFSWGSLQPTSCALTHPTHLYHWACPGSENRAVQPLPTVSNTVFCGTTQRNFTPVNQNFLGFLTSFLTLTDTCHYPISGNCSSLLSDPKFETNCIRAQLLLPLM